MIFRCRHVVLPVVHVTTEEQALRNTRIARDAGADGVFLINHAVPVEDLLAIHRRVVATHPDWWIGVNCLGVSPAEVFKLLPPRVAGVWVDDAKIREDRGADEQWEVANVVRARDELPERPLIFGGVAFKYQREVTDLEGAASLGARWLDVVTTSGPGTGHAADLEKIRRMRRALPSTPLAVASGITPDNVTDYLPYVDAFLVATGISKTFEELDPDRVRTLVDRVRAWRGPTENAPAYAPPPPWPVSEARAWTDADDVIPLVAPSPEKHALVAASFRDLAARLSIWAIDTSATLMLWSRHDAERRTIPDLLRALDLPVTARFGASLGKSSRPVEDGYFSCLHLDSAAGATISAERAIASFVRAELDAHPNVEGELRTRYGKLTDEQRALPRFDHMDHPVFDNGTGDVGFGLFVQIERWGPTHIWCWSRVVHHHK